MISNAMLQMSHRELGYTSGSGATREALQVADAQTNYCAKESVPPGDSMRLSKSIHSFAASPLLVLESVMMLLFERSASRTSVLFVELG